MKTLITGGAGFIGSHLAEAHLEQGDEVYIIDDLSTGSMDNIKHLQDNPAYEKSLFVHINTILHQDLMLELTRAANLVCDRTRERIMATYRLNEGVLLVESGPHMDLSFVIHRVEYRPEERGLRPYPGLTEFKTIRAQRAFHFGEGTSTDDPAFRVSEAEPPDGNGEQPGC